MDSMNGLTEPCSVVSAISDEEERDVDVDGNESPLDESPSKPLLPSVPPSHGPHSVSLGVLIDYAVQKTYHELTILSELLAKKSDMERKISIIQFAAATRQLFIRMLAVVKWVKQSTNIDQTCSSICYVLDQQSEFFVDTADRLFHMARDELMHARLAALQMPAAVDVLTLGSYPRLPACIKSNFVPEDEPSHKETAGVLKRLNQIIQYRLVSSDSPLPARMSNILIKNGMMRVHVGGEFEASLTLLGEQESTPWTLLNLKILVEDFEIGDGTELVHPLQLHYLHEIVQARMNAAVKPLQELFNIVHSFCVWLQLDVYYCQTLTLIHDRALRDHLQVEYYEKGKALNIAYWKQVSGVNRRSGVDYRIRIGLDEDKIEGALHVVHLPVSQNLPVLSGNDSHIQPLLCHTALVRVKHRLNEIAGRLKRMGGVVSWLSGESVPSLSVGLLWPCATDEILTIHINLLTGVIILDVDILNEDEDTSLNATAKLLEGGSDKQLYEAIKTFKIKVAMCRCGRVMKDVPVHVLDHIPLDKEAVNQMTGLSNNRLYLHLYKHQGFYMILCFDLKNDEVVMKYYLMNATLNNTNILASKSTHTSSTSTCITGLLRVVSLTELDKIGLAEIYRDTVGYRGDESQPSTSKGYSEDKVSQPSTSRKRHSDGLHCGLPRKICRMSCSLVEDVRMVIYECEQRIALYILSQEFVRLKVKCHVYMPDYPVGEMTLRIVRVSETQACGLMAEQFWENIRSCVVRVQVKEKGPLEWVTELRLTNTPLHDQYYPFTSLNERSIILQKNVSEGAASCADEFLNLVCAFSRLYDPVSRFSSIYHQKFKDSIKVKTYSYHRLVLGYGPDHSFCMVVRWKHQTNNFDVSFAVQGTTHYAWNPHKILTQYIQTRFNEDKDLGVICEILLESVAPLFAIQQLSRAVKPLRAFEFGVPHNLMELPRRQDSLAYPLVSGFNTCVISESVIRVVYRGQIVLEMKLLGGGYVALRDCGGWSSHTSSSPQALPCFRAFCARMQSKCQSSQNLFQWPHFKANDTFKGEQPKKADTIKADVSEIQPVGSPSIQQCMTPSPAPLSNNPLMTPSPAPIQFAMAHSPATPRPHPSPAAPPPTLIAPSPLSVQQPPSVQGSTWCDSVGNPASVNFSTNDVDGMDPRPNPILVSHQAFLYMCSASTQCPTAPLQSFLASVISMRLFLNRIQQKYRQSQSASQASSSYQMGQVCWHSFEFTVKSVRVRIFLDEMSDFKLKLHLTSMNDKISVEDLGIFEMYFLKELVPVQMVEGFLAVIDIFRLEPPSLIKSMANLLRNDMNYEHEEGVWYRASFCPIVPLPHLRSIQPLKPFVSGTSAVTVNSTDNNLLFWLKLSPNWAGCPRDHITLPLHFDGTKLKLFFQPDNPSEVVKHINAILGSHAETYNKNSNDSCVWPSIVALCRNLQWPSHRS